MSSRDDEVAVLAHGLAQAHQILEGLSGDDLSNPTPCEEWTVSQLVDHLVSGPGRFAQMMRGEDVDWSTTPAAGPEPAAAFRGGADDLLAAWREAGDDVPMGPDWQSAEIAVHTYDLAAALDRSTADLDAEVAERGLAFMQATMRPEMRGEAFRPEQAAPDGADAYERIAAFAGRTVTASR